MRQPNSNRIPDGTALIRANIEIVQALVEALIEPGSLSGEQIDSIISREFEIDQAGTAASGRLATHNGVSGAIHIRSQNANLNYVARATGREDRPCVIV
jgi:hypothetical protein